MKIAAIKTIDEHLKDLNEANNLITWQLLGTGFISETLEIKDSLTETRKHLVKAIIALYHLRAEFTE
jgi:hypothetical protein